MSSVSPSLLQGSTTCSSAAGARMCCRALYPPPLQLPPSTLACWLSYFFSLLWLVCPLPRRPLGPATGGRLGKQHKPVPIPRRAHARPRDGLCLVAWLAWLPHVCATAGLAQFGLDVAGGSTALATWTGTNPCTGSSNASVWSGVTCTGSVPVKLALSGLGLNGTVSCAASAITSLTSIDLVRASAHSLSASQRQTLTRYMCNSTEQQQAERKPPLVPGQPDSSHVPGRLAELAQRHAPARAGQHHPPTDERV